MVLKLTLNCGSTENCIELANFILEYRGVNASLIKYEVKNNCLEILIYGTAAEKSNAKVAILKAFREWRHITSWKKEGGEVEVKYLVKAVGKPFITEALIEVLNIDGIKAEVRDGRLKCNAGWNVIYSIASKLASALEDLAHIYPKSSHSAKALITSYAVLANVSVSEALNYLREARAISVSGHRVLVKKEWRCLLRELLERK